MCAFTEEVVNSSKPKKMAGPHLQQKLAKSNKTIKN